MGAFHALAVALAAALLPSVLAHNVEGPTCSYPVRPFDYVGCFAESDPNTLSFRSNANMYNMTVEQCWSVCKGNGFRYAGLEYYGICFCGNAVMGPQISESQCNYGCSGDNSQTCGGDNSISVYKDTTWPEINKDDVSDYASLGCVYDNSPNGRALPYPASKYFGSGMTTEVCLAACKAGGYPYAGTQYSSECWCGLSLGADAYSTPDDCQMPCAGDNSEMCGGPSRLNVYYASDMQSSEPCGSYAPPQLAASVGTSSTATFAAQSITLAVSSTSTSVELNPSSPSAADIPVAPTHAVTASSSFSDVNQASTSLTDAVNPKKLPTDVPTVVATDALSISSPASPTSSSLASQSPSSSTLSTSSSTPFSASSTISAGSSTSLVSSSSASTPSISTTSTRTSTLSTSSTPASTSKPATTTAPTTTSKPATSSTSSVCYATSTIPSTCEYKCGSWCNDPVPDFSNQTGCQSAASNCKIQVASCFATAGFPGALDCFSYSSWCSNIASYCTSKTAGLNKANLFSSNPPAGVPATTTTVTIPCSAVATSTKTPAPNPTKAPIPVVANICKQPSDTRIGYRPGNPVGGIDMPILTCNDLVADWFLRPFKLYTSSDSTKCKSYSRLQVPSACADACKVQYDECIGVYAESCRQTSSGQPSFWDAFFGQFGRHRRSGELDRRASGWSDTYNGAVTKCKTQYNDCVAENMFTSGIGKCGLWASGW